MPSIGVDRVHAAAALWLVAKGKLSLDDTAGTWFPDLAA